MSPPPPTVWVVFCMLWELLFQNSQKKSCHPIFPHVSWPDACRKLTRTWSSHFCCWILWRALLTGSACFLPILQSSMHSWFPLVFQPSGRTDKRLCSRCHFFYSLSFSLDFLRLALLIWALVAIEWISIHQSLFQSFTSSLNYLDREALSSSCPHLLLLGLHLFL